MKYKIGEEFVLEFPVQVTAIDIDSICRKKEIKYTLRGELPNGTTFSGNLYEPIEEEETTCKK